ncbi:MAG: sigma-70 family RNA polymerase sigma factor [Acidobacteria bacterium]|nr:sigma-70 family RNA polymerase sigma factor [Acidobacteriota bacterium]
MFLRTESDAALVARTRRGDVEAFNYLISRWEKRVYNYLLRLVAHRPGYREDALDLAQDAFLKAYQSIGTLADAEKFAPWLYRIAHNVAFSYLRRPATLGLVEEGGQDQEGQWSNDWPAEWKDNAPLYVLSPQPALGREMQIAVARALDALSAEQREAIVLKVYHGFRFDEIAEIISCPVSTVKTRVYAGFAQLRAVLESIPSSSKRIAHR